MGDPLENITRYNEDPSWAREVGEFAAAIKDRKEIRHGSADDALQTMALVYRIYCADAEWRDRWNLQDVASAESSK